MGGVALIAAALARSRSITNGFDRAAEPISWKTSSPSVGIVTAGSTRADAGRHERKIS